MGSNMIAITIRYCYTADMNPLTTRPIEDGDELILFLGTVIKKDDSPDEATARFWIMRVGTTTYVVPEGQREVCAFSCTQRHAELELGRWEHTKSGHRYLLLGVVFDERGTQYAWYTSLYESEEGGPGMFVRPINSFREKFTFLGVEMPPRA